MRSLNRREFFHDSAVLSALAAGGALGGSAVADPVALAAKDKGSANDRLRVAVVGVNGRGMAHVGGFANRNNCVITTICDADSAVIGRAMRQVEKVQDRAPKFQQDLRRVVEDKNIDIVSIATPNHWHALAAIWAMQHGKDVYVEKPVSHNVSEGRRVVEVARQTGRICQAGTQSRSNPGMQEIMAFLHSGGIGKVKVARGICYKLRGSIGKVSAPTPIPDTVNYDLWCGPAPMKPLMRQRLHYDWHWVWDTGNGDLGNQGIHEMDKARWGLGKMELARSVISFGGRFGYVDDGETANTQVCLFDFGDCQLVFEVRGLLSQSPFPGKEARKIGNFVGNIFYGTDGYLVSTDYKGGIAFRPNGEVIKRFTGEDDHFANFVKAVRSRKAGDLNADILEGHLSSALCHLGNISYRLGTPQPFNKKAKALGDDKEAVASLESMAEHLKSHDLKLNETSYRLGRRLSVDPKTETFVGDKEADQMLTREYRKGFEIQPANA